MLASFDFYNHPAYFVLCCYALCTVTILCTDRIALPQVLRQSMRDERSLSQLVMGTLASLMVIAYVYAAFFAISWRPIYASQGTISFFVIFNIVSRIKYQFIREPIIFSDLALVLSVFKHKTIFYATWLNLVFWAFAVLYVFGASALYMYFEPHLLPQTNSVLWMAALPLCIIAGSVLLCRSSYIRPISRFCSSVIKRIEPKRNTFYFGTFPSLALQFLLWLGTDRGDIVVNIKQSKKHRKTLITSDKPTSDQAPLIIIWQSESFIDLRRFGVDNLKLPNIDRLKRKAVQWGRLSNIFEGGYTLRTEFSVLSGLPPHLLDSDASYPYLRASHYADVVWPSKLKEAGWHTHFIHPYDQTFFSRHKAIPSLGFDAMTMLDAFEHDPSRDGPYVSDYRLAEKVSELALGVNCSDPALLFVASMGNHGPWEKGRFADLDDPVSIYMHLLEEADRAIGKLHDELKHLDRPVWLAFYGDHAPLLKSFADPFPDPRTDYFIVPLSSAAKKAPTVVHPREEAPWSFIERVLGHAGIVKEAH